MKKIVLLLLVVFLSFAYAETVPVLINEKEYKGEKIGEYIFVTKNNLLLYKDKVYDLIKIEDYYISKDVGILFDGKDIFKIILHKDLILCPDKNILFKDEKKYETKNLGKIYFAITGYNYNLSEFKLFAYGIYPKWRYILLELCIFNLNTSPIVLQQNMFKLRVGNKDYYPDSASSIYLSSEGKEVLFKRPLNPNEGISIYLIYDVPGLPDKLKIDLSLGLQKPFEITLPQF
ncbi:MAG: hypothetical protein ACPLKX_03335 [Dictyoglomaceae bacterium]